MQKAEPKFICSSGVTFELRPIPPLNLDDFNNAYDEMYPPPIPALMEINVAGKMIAQPDTRDPYFVMLLQNWGARKEAAARHFLLARGVINDPPSDYLPDDSLYAGELSRGKRKALWVSDQLHNVEDIKQLIEAIQSLNNITETGLEESKNGTPPSLADLTSSNGQSNQTLAPSALITP
jgi:hypothetical protein